MPCKENAPWPAPRTPTAPRRAAAPRADRAATAQYDESDRWPRSEPDAAAQPGWLARHVPDARHPRRPADVLPRMLAHTPKLWIPFGMLSWPFVLAVLLTQGTTTGRMAGRFTSSSCPSGVESIAVPLRRADPAADRPVRVLHRRVPGAPRELPRRRGPGPLRRHPVVPAVPASRPTAELDVGARPPGPAGRRLRHHRWWRSWSASSPRASHPGIATSCARRRSERARTGPCASSSSEPRPRKMPGPPSARRPRWPPAPRPQRAAPPHQPSADRRAPRGARVPIHAVPPRSGRACR